MDTTVTAGYRPTRADRIGIYVFMAAGLAIITWSLYATISRIYQLILGEDIRTLVHLVDTRVQVPIAGTTDTVPMEIETAYVTATHLPAAAFGAGLIAVVLGFLVMTTVVTCLLLLARNTLRGKIFSRSNTHLVVTAGLTALVGFGLAPVFEGVVGSETIADMTNGAFTQSAVFVAEPLPFVLLGFAFAIMATAFTVGARMQRDQDGLV